MAYITKSNSLKIIEKIDFKQIENANDEIYKMPIYFFSDYEKKNLLGFKKFLIDPEPFIKEFYISIENTDNLRYVFEGGKPAYHSTPDCERLNSSFRNFEIPDEIRIKGKEEVLKFRNWFKENLYLLEKVDVFAARLQITFGVRINPKAIDFENSGIEIKENLNLDELEQRINKYLSEAGQYFKKANKDKKEIIKRFQKHTYLAYSYNSILTNDTRFSDDVIKNFLMQYDIHFKKPVKDLLTEYYRVLHNPDLKFEGKLLEQLGFRACGTCHNKTLDQDSNISYADDETPIL